ncbi:MAG TPA: hypothetical protein VHU40_08285 [Polyangia bacterium]|nr:hypothetical protein [Polyangia bacterium]
MITVRALLLGLVALSLAACRPTTPAGRYEKDGLGFEYLAGWQVTEDSQRTARFVNVEGPDHAVLGISIFAPHLDVSLDRYVEATTDARSAGVKKTLTVAGVNLGSEDPIAAPTPIERNVAGAPVHGLEQHFTIKVINTAVPHTVDFLRATLADRALLLMAQSADKHRDAANTGFQKIFDTLALRR